MTLLDTIQDWNADARDDDLILTEDLSVWSQYGVVDTESYNAFMEGLTDNDKSLPDDLWTGYADWRYVQDERRLEQEFYESIYGSEV